MSTTRPVAAALLLAALAGGPSLVTAGIKCWTNKDGVRECGNAVPPEYAQQGHEELNRRGMVIKEQERAKTREELAAEAAERERIENEKAERLRALREKANRDRVLLDTFTTEEDLLLARDGKLGALDARIQHTRQVVEKLHDNLASLKRAAANAELSGGQVSDKMHDDIQRVKRQIRENQGFIEQRRQEKQELTAQFQADLERYRQLKSN